MTNRKAITSQPVIGAFRVQLVSGFAVTTDDPQQAKEIADALDAAYECGRREAQRDIRKAIGLRDWGGDVKIEAESV